MKRAAQITDVEQLRPLKTAMVRFQHDSADALEMLRMQIQRAVEWLEHDRPAYWKEEVRRRWEKVNAARAELERAKMRKVADREPPCRDEKAALAKAKDRLQFAEIKQREVRTWCLKVQHEVSEYESRACHLTSTLEGDFPRALNTLERMITALEKYLAPVGGAGSSAPTDADTSAPPEQKANDDEHRGS